mmetsp:Transcript_96163/g.170684  ORF Transcript_96163/g.170684 Transcript_96163/m.170684 type:complete len:222 (-) Transcript_96163:835-1500(-)
MSQLLDIGSATKPQLSPKPLWDLVSACVETANPPESSTSSLALGPCAKAFSASLETVLPRASPKVVYAFVVAVVFAASSKECSTSPMASPRLSPLSLENRTLLPPSADTVGICTSDEEEASRVGLSNQASASASSSATPRRLPTVPPAMDLPDLRKPLQERRDEETEAVSVVPANSTTLDLQEDPAESGMWMASIAAAKAPPSKEKATSVSDVEFKGSLEA